MLHFASELFDSHPRFIQLKSMLLDFFNGELMDAVALRGLEHVISVSLAPTPPTVDVSAQDTVITLPKVHLRSYTVKLLASGSRTPRVELVPMGPSIDLSLRRHKEADPDMWKSAMKRPKLKKQDIEQGLGQKRKNIEVDDMGDLRGRLQVAQQDLNKLQTRKMKGLKATLGGDDGDGDSTRPRKRRQTHGDVDSDSESSDRT